MKIAIQTVGAWLLLLPWLAVSCGNPVGGASAEVTSLGKVEVTARLSEILGTFPPNDLYDYAYVMKYRVIKIHRGQIEGQDIYVGHFNPLKPRAGAADKFTGKIGGNVDRFRVGDVHRMALDYPLDQVYIGGIIDKHIKESGIRYWAIWTERARE